MDYNPKTVLSIEQILVGFAHMHEIKEEKKRTKVFRRKPYLLPILMLINLMVWKHSVFLIYGEY